MEITMAVRFPDCDPMGIVHHAVYPIWYEVARMEIFKTVSFPWMEMNELGIDPAMVDLHIQYLAPLYYPAEVTVRAEFLFCEGKKLKLRYETWFGEQCVNRAESFHVWTKKGPEGAKNLKSIALGEHLPAVYAAIRAQCPADA